MSLSAASLKALREKRAEVAKQIRQLAEKANQENRDFSAEEKPSWEAANKDYDALSRQIEIAKRGAEIDADMTNPAGDRSVGREDRDGREGFDLPENRSVNRDPQGSAGSDAAQDKAHCFRAWFKRQSQVELSREEREACKRARFNPGRSTLEIPLARVAPRTQAEARAAMTGTSLAGGGALIPDGFVNRLERALLQFGAMRSVSEIMRTNDGAEMPWPTTNDTSNTGALIGESPSSLTETPPTLSAVVFRAYKFTSNLIKVPVELLEDSAFDLVALLGDMMGERLGRCHNAYFTTGTGASQPKGITLASYLGVTAASATAIAADEVFGLLHSVDPAYRENGKWMAHDNTLLALRKLKDSQNRYLWESSMQADTPDMLLGKPFITNQQMQSTLATATKTLFFGDFSKYKIRDVGSIRIRRLVERYADADQEGFIAFSRNDGNLIDAGTHPVKHLLQA